MRIQHLLAALALTALTATPALAQAGQEVTTMAVPVPVTGAGLLTVTPFLSFTFAARTHPDSCCTGSGLGIGAAVGYDINDRVGVEGEFGYVFDLIGDSVNDWSALNLGANVLYHVPLASGLAPYGLFGIGINRTAQQIDDIVSDSTEFGFNLGGGVKAPLSEAFTARGDIRFFKGNDQALDGWRIYGGVSWKLRR